MSSRMSAAARHGDGAAGTKRLVRVASAALLGVTVALVLFVALRSPLKDDIAWLLYVARRWLAGQTLYVDVMEVNPPLIIWFSAIPVLLARWLGADAGSVAILIFVAVVLACGWWSTCLLRPRGGLFSDRLPVFAVLGAVLLIVPAGDLGQREHLLAAAMLPYLVLFARRLDGEPVGVRDALVAGVVAGLGCGLKPQYCLVLALLEGVALAYGSRPWRALPMAAAATLLGYGALILIVCPAYLHRAVPMALALYGSSSVTLTHLLADCAAVIAEGGAAFGLFWARRRGMAESRLMLTLLVFAAGATCVCLLDGKDWYYHRIPATLATILALVLWWSSERARRGWSFRLPLAIATVALGVVCYQAEQRMAPAVAEAMAPGHTVEARLEAILRGEKARSYVAFSDWLALGFPVVNETGVKWASRFDSMWALDGEVWRAGFDPRTRTAWPVAQWVAHDFIAGCPDVVVVDRASKIDYLAVLRSASPAFERVWKRYRRIGSIGALQIYRRAVGGCANVSVAAAGEAGARVR